MNIKASPQIKSILFFTLSLLVLQAGCGTTDTGTSRTAGVGTLQLTLQANRSWLKAGESVRVRFTVTSYDTAPVVIESKNFPVLDISVHPVGSDQVLTSWSSQNPNQVSHSLAWKPGESKVLELTWTASNEEFGRLIFLSGFLIQNSGNNQSATVSLCVGYEICH